MKLTIALVADFANSDTKTGKLNVLGVFTRINARRFPTVQPRMAIVIQIRPELGDPADQQHTLKVLLVSPDGKELMQISGPFSLPHGTSGSRPDFNAILELNNLPLPETGEYAFKVWVDDEFLEDIPVLVMLAESE